MMMECVEIYGKSNEKGNYDAKNNHKNVIERSDCLKESRSGYGNEERESYVSILKKGMLPLTKKDKTHFKNVRFTTLGK